MIDCKGQTCPICNVRFLENDDVVVCPDCGTPHHRACYKERGSCANNALHAGEYSWKPTAPEPLPKSCPNCNTTNKPGVPFCGNCGVPLDTPVPIEVKTNENFLGAVSAIEMFEQITNISDNEELDGIKVKDWRTYIGKAAPRYLFSFKRMDVTKQKINFSLTAMLFAPIFFLYRRMWLLGILALLIDMLLSVPSSIRVIQALYGLEISVDEATLNTLTYIASILAAVVNTAWGAFAIYLYRKSAIKNIKKMKKEAGTEEAYQQVLTKKAGPCNVVMIVSVGLMVFSFVSILML